MAKKPIKMSLIQQSKKAIWGIPKNLAVNCRQHQVSIQTVIQIIEIQMIVIQMMIQVII